MSEMNQTQPEHRHQSLVSYAVSFLMGTDNGTKWKHALSYQKKEAERNDAEIATFIWVNRYQIETNASVVVGSFVPCPVVTEWKNEVINEARKDQRQGTSKNVTTVSTDDGFN